MKHAKLCLAVGILLLTASGVLVGKRSASALQSNSVYHYAYVSSPTGDALDTLYLVDPRQPDTDPRAVPLPIPEGQSFVAAEASPTGEWLYLLTSSAEGSLLQLFDPETLETRVVFTSSMPVQYTDYSPDPIPVWSPDGQSLAFLAFDTNWDAFSAYHYSLASGEVAIIYRSRRYGEGGEYFDDVSQLAWRPDSAALALYERDCIDLGVRECTYRFAVVGVPDGTLIAESAVEFDSPALYQLSWSPDGQYLGFHYQTGASVGWFGAEFYEAMVWQPTTDTVTQMTHFTNPLPIEDAALNIYSNRFYLHWLDTAQILTAYYVNGYTYQLDHLSETVYIGTDIYTISELTSIPLLSDFIWEWAPNPVTNEVAIMSTYEPLDSIGIPQFQSRTVQLGSFDGETLNDLMQLPDGYELRWSPDGAYLGYLQVEDDFGNAAYSDGPIIVSQVDRAVHFLPLFDDRGREPITIGWVAFTDPPTG
jgi:hypothetical protein